MNAVRGTPETRHPARLAERLEQGYHVDMYAKYFAAEALEDTATLAYICPGSADIVFVLSRYSQMCNNLICSFADHTAQSFSQHWQELIKSTEYRLAVLEWR